MAAACLVIELSKRIVHSNDWVGTAFLKVREECYFLSYAHDISHQDVQKDIFSVASASMCAQCQFCLAML